MKTIFIVDDNDTNLMTAKTALDGIYRTFAMPSAARMFKLAEKITPDLIRIVFLYLSLKRKKHDKVLRVS